MEYCGGGSMQDIYHGTCFCYFTSNIIARMAILYLVITNACSLQRTLLLRNGQVTRHYYAVKGRALICINLMFDDYCLLVKQSQMHYIPACDCVLAVLKSVFL